MSQKVTPKPIVLDPENSPRDAFHFYTCPLRVVSCFFGFWPVSLKGEKHAFSPFFFIYGTTLLTLSCVYRIYLEPESRPGFIFQVMKVRNLLIPISFLLSGFVLSIKVKKFVKCLNSIYSLRGFITLPQLKLSFCLQIILIITGLIFHSILIGLFFYFQPKLTQNLRMVQALALDLYMLNCLYLVKLHFFFGLRFLKNVLIVVREDITALEKQAIPLSFTPITVDVTHLADLYDFVLKQARTFNDSFGLGLGVVTIVTVVNCFTAGYFYFVIRGDGFDVYLTFWVLLDLSQVWLVLMATEQFTKETSLLAVAVSKSLRTVSDKKIVRQLKQFSAHLLHCKPKFTLCGMVNLDYTLFFTIAGAVTTYMIVLVQFQKTEGNATYNFTDFPT